MPLPKKTKGETKKHYASKVISAETRAGKPHKQAIAIGMSKAGLSNKKKK